MALDHGAVEASFATGQNSDILLTPDFRILIAQKGHDAPGEDHQAEHRAEAELKAGVVEIERVVNEHRKDAERQHVQQIRHPLQWHKMILHVLARRQVSLAGGKLIGDAGPGGTNVPGWADNGFVDISLYVPAIDPSKP